MQNVNDLATKPKTIDASLISLVATLGSTY